MSALTGVRIKIRLLSAPVLVLADDTPHSHQGQDKTPDQVKITMILLSSQKYKEKTLQKQKHGHITFLSRNKSEGTHPPQKKKKKKKKKATKRTFLYRLYLNIIWYPSCQSRSHSTQSKYPLLKYNSLLL